MKWREAVTLIRSRTQPLEDDWSLLEAAEALADKVEGLVKRQERLITVKGHDHVLSLRRVLTYPRRSEETTCFSAELLAGTVKVADVDNDGGGGSHKYLWTSHFYRKMITAWALAQETEYPVDKLDQIVNKLLEDYIEHKA